jgi:hypothetical protein
MHEPKNQHVVAYNAIKHYVRIGRKTEPADCLSCCQTPATRLICKEIDSFPNAFRNAVRSRRGFFADIDKRFMNLL